VGVPPFRGAANPYTTRSVALGMRRGTKLLFGAVLCGGLVVLAGLAAPRLALPASPPQPETLLAAVLPVSDLAIRPSFHGIGDPLEFPSTANWPVLGHDNGRSGDALNETVLTVADAGGLERVWASNANGSLGIVSGSLTVSDGFLYVGGWNGKLFELNAASGDPVWNLSLAPRYHLVNWSLDSTFWNEGGIASTPAVVSRTVGNASYTTVYVTAGSEYLYAINASTQPAGGAPTVEWRQNTTSYSPLSSGSTEWGYHYLWSSPVIEGAYAYVGLSALYDHIPIQAQVLQLPLQGPSHAPSHVFDVTGQSLNPNDVEGSIWSTPAVDPSTNTLWVATGNNNGLFYSGIQPLTESLIGLNLSNVTDVRGSYRVSEPADGNLDNDFGAGPTLFSSANGSALVGAINKNGGFYAYNRTNFSRGPCVNDSDLAGGHCLLPAWAGAVPKLAAATSGDYENSVSPAAFGDGRLFVAGGYTAGFGGGSVNAIDPSNGTLLWRDGLSGECPLGGLTYANGLVVYASDGCNSTSADSGAYGPAQLVVLNASSGRSLWTTQLNESVAGAPIVSDGRIFVGTGNFSTMSGADGIGWVDAFGIPLRVNASAAPVVNSTTGYAFRSAVVGGMPPYAYLWQFGDGSPDSSVPDPVHDFATPGSHNVSLQVGDLAGDLATTRFEVQITPSGSATFSRNPIDAGVPGWINYTAQSATPLVTIHWSGLPAPCTSANVVDLPCTPAIPGGYALVVNWTNSTGARGSTDLRQFTVDADPALTVAAVAVPAPGSANASISTSATGGTPPYQIEIGFGDGSSPVTASSAVHAYGAPGAYTISAELADGGGGTASASTTFTVPVPPSPSVEAWGNVSASGGGTNYCIGNTGRVGTTAAWQNVSFAAVAWDGQAPYSFSWSFGDGSAVEPGPRVNHSFAGFGSWSVRVNVTDSNGAMNSTSLNVSHPPPPDPVPFCRKTAVPPQPEGSLLPVGLGIAGAAALAAALLFWGMRRRRRLDPPRSGEP
jgi:outer membrane protein assembly factor BamB